MICFCATVPAGDTCKPLSPIENGGVIYSDLLLSPGVVANYVCEQGYSIHGHPSRTCAPDGSWIDSEKGYPVCEGIDSFDEPSICILNYEFNHSSILNISSLSVPNQMHSIAEHSIWTCTLYKC